MPRTFKLFKELVSATASRLLPYGTYSSRMKVRMITIENHGWVTRANIEPCMNGVMSKSTAQAKSVSDGDGVVKSNQSLDYYQRRPLSQLLLNPRWAAALWEVSLCF